MRSAIYAAVLCSSVVAAQAATVTVSVEGVESSKGEVKVGLCDKGLSKEQCPLNQERPAQQGKMEFKFENVPPGRWAVASYHDVNMNDEFDRTLGFPREPFGISNDGGGGMVPEFQGSTIRVGDGETKVTVRLRRALDR